VDSDEETVPYETREGRHGRGVRRSEDRAVAKGGFGRDVEARALQRWRGRVK
jgi:hypothetical protein